MKTVIVLAMHGVPPADYPPQESSEVVGFNEYCGPSVDGAIDQSVARGAKSAGRQIQGTRLSR